MLDVLHHLDQAVFLFLNVELANPVFDVIMPVITSDSFLRFSFGVALVLLLWKGPSRTRWLVLYSLLTLGVTDQLSSHLLKPLIGRARPCQVLGTIHLLVVCGGGKAMPSSHAANAFGQAMLFALAFPRARVYLLVAAGLIAISRVFVGVHYPGDVIVGSVLGCLCGAAVFYIFTRTAGSRCRQDPESVVPGNSPGEHS
jgi:undecaprenyl-diphosphatase